MRWELDYEEKGFVIEASRERGLPTPEWADNEPKIFDGDEFYLGAFNDLSTCRPVGLSLGPIPWRDIIDYARYHGLDRLMTDFFLRVMRGMDTVYLKWQRGKKPKDNG